MLKEEKAFLVVMSIAIGTISSSVAIIGRYLPLANGLLLGLAISLSLRRALSTSHDTKLKLPAASCMESSSVRKLVFFRFAR